MLRKISVGKYIFSIIFIILSFFKFFTVVLKSKVSDITSLVFSYKPIITSNKVMITDMESYIANNNFKIISEGSMDTFTVYELVYSLWGIFFIIGLTYII